MPVAERWLLSVAEASEAPNIFTEKSRISAALNDRDFFVRCRVGACSDCVIMLIFVCIIQYMHRLYDFRGFILFNDRDVFFGRDDLHPIL